MTRIVKCTRETKETSVELELNLDGTGQYDINTGIGFLDHMLEQLSFHGLFDLTLRCKGDLHIDSHHTTEDIALTLGDAFLQALGEKKGIRRYAHAYIPMDEALLRTVVDLSGRPEFHFQGKFTQLALGGLATELIPHFFKSFAMASRITLHMAILYGTNDHHTCEGLFKSLARALYDAVQIDPRREVATSTKGTLS
ncbi:MAG: imidazoleglycerol-phosphate dehydratase HisB [SAR324 cluster bacterium]|nr:imidazoleglycerol-phosphate dehydratase HisB [SAR324 cluster bacterium]